MPEHFHGKERQGRNGGDDDVAAEDRCVLVVMVMSLACLFGLAQGAFVTDLFDGLDQRIGVATRYGRAFGGEIDRS